MTNNALLCTGLCGTAVAGICCITPAAVVALTAIGASALVGWLDIVLLPALVAFLALTGFALWQRRRA